MKIETDKDYIGVDESHPWAKHFYIIKFEDGLTSLIPKNFFQDWLGESTDIGVFYISKCSGFGVQSIVKYDTGLQSLRVGRFVSGGMRLKFLLNGQHETRTMSTYMLSIQSSDLKNPLPPQYGDSIIKNDVWIGDEMMMLGGGTIEDGCIIGARSLLPPNFKSEPYGIYAGSPAHLIRFRFSEKIIELLLDLSWWDMPDLLNWVKEINPFFLIDFTKDEHRTLSLLEEIKAKKNEWINQSTK